MWDLFCGVGALGLTVASRSQQVIGVEVIESAVQDAARNAQHNGIDNASFHAMVSAD